MASTSEKNTRIDSETVAESYDDLTVVNETDSPIRLYCCFAVPVILSLQLAILCLHLLENYWEIIG